MIMITPVLFINKIMWKGVCVCVWVCVCVCVGGGGGGGGGGGVQFSHGVIP